MHRYFPLPDVEWEPTREYWAGAARGELMVTRCNTCGRYVWYPQPPCRACGGHGVTWTAVSGRGTLFSWSVLHYPWIPQFRQQLPFVTGLVALQEDPTVRLVSYIVDGKPEALRCDMPVEAVFRELRYPGIEGVVMVPMFRPQTEQRM